MKRLVTIFLTFLPILGIMAQQELTRQGSSLQRQNLIRTLPEDPEKVRAVQMATRNNLPVRVLHPDGRIVEIRRLNPHGQPEYMTTHNLNAAKTVSSSRVWQGAGSGYSLSGDGIVVGIWDAGIIRNTHQEFGSRGVIMNAFGEEGGHATHVGGTIGAAGINPSARGMANKAVLESYDWNGDLAEMEVAGAMGLLLSNHSYGYVIGWSWNFELSRWEWYGDTEISGEEDYLFGFYHPEAQDYDLIAYNNPYYLVVKSAGNDRGEGPDVPGESHYVWGNSGWELSDEPRPLDGGIAGFETMGPVSVAKNIMAVGAIADLPDGFTDTGTVEMTDFSSFGPTDDGRIKPDVVGNGEWLFSTYSDSDDDYANSSGTSMAAPNITGSMALLQEHYHALNDTYMRSASLKGLVLHTADDAGNPGPDYKYGFGVMNTLSAAEVISDNGYPRIQEHILDNGEEIRISLFSEGDVPVKATICWTDVPGEVPEASLDPPDRILVNDLDLRIVRKEDGSEHLPFILNPAAPDEPAVRGDNLLDNVEQVVVDQPAKGAYEIIISHKGTLWGGSQAFSLLFSGLEYAFYASGGTTLMENNGTFILTSADEYLPDMEARWLIKPENKQQVSLYLDFMDTEQGSDVLKVYDGPNPASPLLAELSGYLTGSDTLLESSGSAMFVSFTSDGHHQEKGFKVVYCTVAPEGSFSVSGETHPCTGTKETYSASGTDGTKYRWEPPEGWDLDVTGYNTASLSIGSGSSQVSAVPYNQCGESAAAGLTINPLSLPPDLEGYSGDTVLCAGEQGSLSVDNLPGATYEWLLPENWLGTSETHELDYIPSLTQGQIGVTAYNACAYGDTLIISVQVNTIPDQIQVFTASEQVCEQSLNQFYVGAQEGIRYAWSVWSVQQDWQVVGDSLSDTVSIQVGSQYGRVSVNATNQCGSRSSSRSVSTVASPDPPMMASMSSVYEDYMKIELQNATAYSSIQWLRNNEIIDSPGATGSSIIAYIPGTYSVQVTNREGCVLQQDSTSGINVSGPGNYFGVHAGSNGTIVVEHEYPLADPATLNVVDLMGNIQIIKVINPGHNEIPTHLRGVYIVSISGLGETQIFRIFIH